MNLKQKLYQFCLNHIYDKIAVCQETLNGIQESLSSETKSSAGDKHETGRAMIQLEREQMGNQYVQLEKEKNVLEKIALDSENHKIKEGNLVRTNQHHYFLAISIGKITIDDQDYYAISSKSPIGQLLLGKTVGETIKFRNQEIEILAII